MKEKKKHRVRLASFEELVTMGIEEIRENLNDGLMQVSSEGIEEIREKRRKEEEEEDRCQEMLEKTIRQD